MKKVVLSLMMVGLLGSFASAELLEEWDEGLLSNIAESATHSSAGAVVLNKTSVHTAGADWLSALLYVELDSGSLFQDPLTASLPWGYISGLNDVDSWLPENVTVFGDANELGSLPGMTGNPAASITFIASLPTDPVPAWDGLAGQFAFTPDSQGVWAYKVSAKGSDAVTFVGTVENGVMVIPEPGTIALLLCGLAGLFVLRRK